jgi:hypothetical protein
MGALVRWSVKVFILIGCLFWGWEQVPEIDPDRSRIDPDFDPCQGEGALQHELSHLAAISTFSRGLSYL